MIVILAGLLPSVIPVRVIMNSANREREFVERCFEFERSQGDVRSEIVDGRRCIDGASEFLGAGNRSNGFGIRAPQGGCGRSFEGSKRR